MDSISLLVGPPPNATRAITQDDFDQRYNYVKFRKKRTNAEISRSLLIGDNWVLYKSATWLQLFPFATWIHKYNMKESLPRDVLGAIYISTLLVPQAIAYGLIIGNVPTAVYSLFIPQLLYLLFGSAHHTSVGALSFVSIMVYSSIEHSKSTISAISLSCGIIQLMQFILPLEFIFSYISTSALSGFSVGLYIRIVLRFIPQFIIFKGHDCNKTTAAAASLISNSTSEVKRVLQCFYASVPCLRSPDALIVISTIISSVFLIAFKWRLSRLISSRLGFSIPHEFLILLAVTVSSFFLQTIPSAEQKMKIPTALLSSIVPSCETFLDGFAIAIYSLTSHMQIAKSIAMEKMYKVHRKQELFCFSMISITSSIFGLLPPSSSYGSSQMNIESSKFSLIANFLSLIPTALIVYFGAPFFSFLPTCAIGVMVLTTFSGWTSELRTIHKTFYSSSWDAAMALAALACAVLMPNICRGFIAMLLISIFMIALRVQFPHVEVLAKLSETHFADETRYEGDCLDTPVRIIRLSGPLLSVNCESVRAELYKQAVVVKGLIGIGIGTRTASLRSQCPSAVGPKESVAARESMNLSTNITIIQECDVSIAAPPSDTAPIVRFLVLSMSGVTAIDKDMLTCLGQVYGDLNGENIRMLFAGVPVTCRDAMDVLGFFNNVPRNSFFPTIPEALLSARNTVLPFHMSVSMNGYRDVIALSTAASNTDLNRGSPEAV